MNIFTSYWRPEKQPASPSWQSSSCKEGKRACLILGC